MPIHTVNGKRRNGKVLESKRAAPREMREIQKEYGARGPRRQPERWRLTPLQQRVLAVVPEADEDGRRGMDMIEMMDGEPMKRSNLTSVLLALAGKNLIERHGRGWRKVAA